MTGRARFARNQESLAQGKITLLPQRTHVGAVGCTLAWPRRGNARSCAPLLLFFTKISAPAPAIFREAADKMFYKSMRAQKSHFLQAYPICRKLSALSGKGKPRRGSRDVPFSAVIPSVAEESLKRGETQIRTHEILRLRLRCARLRFRARGALMRPHARRLRFAKAKRTRPKRSARFCPC